MRSIRRLSTGVALLSLVTAPLLAQNATAARPNPSTPTQVLDKPHPTRPTTYGTTAISYIEVPANAFLPWNSGQTWTSADFGRGTRWPTGIQHDFVAPLRLPSGSLIVYLELDAVDNSATSTVYGSFTACNFTQTSCTYHPAAGSGPADCMIPGFICTGNAAIVTGGVGGDDISSEVGPIDNFFGSYSLLEEPTAADGSVQLAGMIVGYVLQVSPAPGTATFDDVPTTDFAFQFVEAFNAAGITVGCQVSPPLFCPDRNVTRREMAVFFAKALGLQFN